MRDGKIDFMDTPEAKEAAKNMLKKLNYGLWIYIAYLLLKGTYFVMVDLCDVDLGWLDFYYNLTMIFLQYTGQFLLIYVVLVVTLATIKAAKGDDNP